MREAETTLIPENKVHEEIEKIKLLDTTHLRTPDTDLSVKETCSAVSELLPQLHKLASTAGAEEVINFGHGKVGKMAHADVADTDGFQWTLVSYANVASDGRYFDGYQYGRLIKHLPSPNMHRMAEVSSLKDGDPHHTVFHSFNANPEGQRPIGRSLTNSELTVAFTKELIAEYKTTPKNN